MTENNVITGLDIAEASGCKTVVARYQRLMNAIIRSGVTIDTPFKDVEPIGTVDALIDFGRWSARCPTCNGSEYVDPIEPIFYCMSCGNRETDGAPIKVVFPKNRDKIEKLVMKRPVNDSVGRNKIERALNAEPLRFAIVGDKPLPLSRSWTPNESVKDLEKQNKLGGI